ncbi:hypothetical protein SAMN05216456_1306 [Devosia crocina]|uniref:Uncharacterized protein n=1 Tax=Devosia crocina TaxID=429728 RepID=A0A1I7N9H8_9HYPH|nr:hypothetical protein [Devosia crocina]SFV31330.1 hypothetical protein SAMN05216456_1306 [Devosia crocina]
MAEATVTTPAAGASPIAFLAPRRHAIQNAITALEPLLLAEGNTASPRIKALELIFGQLMDELSAVDTVILALPPTSADDLHVQAAITRASVDDYLDRMPLLDKLLQHVEAFAA